MQNTTAMESNKNLCCNERAIMAEMTRELRPNSASVSLSYNKKKELKKLIIIAVTFLSHVILNIVNVDIKNIYPIFNDSI